MRAICKIEQKGGGGGGGGEKEGGGGGGRGGGGARNSSRDLGWKRVGSEAENTNLRCTRERHVKSRGVNFQRTMSITE